MTPEREKEIRADLADETNCGSPNHTSIAEELLADNDALTAEIATLRTRLDALVTAGENLLGDLHTDTITFTRQGSMYQTTADVITVRPAIRDALAAAVREAKGEK